MWNKYNQTSTIIYFPEAYLNSDAAECMAITRFGYMVCFVEAELREQPCAVSFKEYLLFSGTGFIYYF